jgi:hypothetical protein
MNEPEMEPTEMAPSETETGSIYAWGLDDDGVDEPPTRRSWVHLSVVDQSHLGLFVPVVSFWASCPACGVLNTDGLTSGLRGGGSNPPRSSRRCSSPSTVDSAARRAC